MFYIGGWIGRGGLKVAAWVIYYRAVVGDDGGTERSDTFPNFRFRAAVGDDGGTERSGSEATPFRTFDLGRRLGTMVVRSEAVAERHLSELST